jgi:hypothetical protein
MSEQGSSLRAEIRDGLAEHDRSLRTEVSEQGSSLRVEFRDGLADVRRHAVMLNESTRDDIRLVAEAVAVLTVKVDSLRK